jgi:hypothetical protein
VDVPVRGSLVAGVGDGNRATPSAESLQALHHSLAESPLPHQHGAPVLLHGVGEVMCCTAPHSLL